MHASVTHRQLVSEKMTDMTDLKNNDFKDLPTRTFLNKRTFADTLGNTFKGRLRNKQDRAGPGYRDNAGPQYFAYGYVTNGWEELLRRTVTPSKKLLIVQTNEVRDMRPKLKTLGLQDSGPGRVRGNRKKKSPGIPVRSTKVPKTTMMEASVTY